MKKPRLFYYEDSMSAWCPVPKLVEEIINEDCLCDGESTEITFKMVMMTDEEFDNIPEE